MIYKALEIRSDGLVTAQVVLEDGDDKDKAAEEVLTWCREKAEASQPVVSEAPSEDEFNQRLEQEKQTFIQALRTKLEELEAAPHSELTEATFSQPGHIYGEATGGRPIGSVTSSDQASQNALADAVRETFDERAKETKSSETSEVAANG